ncbi:MAG: NADH-quinone oxidoreductase subunit H [Deltaproteobacteria bacterium]|nr:NADH-quinone oxidoreductase subunit H [Deltaproteobacteria bacterium]
MLHLVLIVTTPPFFLGVIAKTKAFLAGRKGPPLLQIYYDLLRLFRKGTVYSRSSSILLRLAPVMIVASIFSSSLLVPLLKTAPIRFEGDLILFAYLLGLVRFMTILAAMDVGSSFEGMGASREASLGALTELAFFLGLVALSAMTRSTSLTAIFEWEGGHPFWNPALLILFATFSLILLTENSRMPIDDPTTHLELTMIHEVMILDYSGPDLALILYGASMKLFLFMAFTSSLLWPPTTANIWMGGGWLILKVTGMSIAIGLIESANARLRLIKIPQLLVANFVAAALGLAIILIGRGV